MKLSPKQRFQQKHTVLAKKHLEWCASDEAHVILETAFAQFADNIPAAPNQMLAVDYHQRLTGAKAFIAELLNLSEPPTERKTRPSDNLTMEMPGRPKSKE